jgi:hypothetical protein
MRSHVVLKLLRALRHLIHGEQWDSELSEEIEAHREILLHVDSGLGTGPRAHNASGSSRRPIQLT